MLNFVRRYILQDGSPAGDNRGYVPSALGFANGGYSADSCWFLPGKGEQFAEELFAGLKRMHG